MKTSWSEVRKIEKFLNGNLSVPESLVFQARLIVDRNLRAQVHSQKLAYHIIREYSRNHLKLSFSRLHDEFMSIPARRREILDLFKTS